MAADKGERHQGGGRVGEVEGYRCDKRGGGGGGGGGGGWGAMRKRKWCVVCPLTYFIRRS